MHNLPGTSDTGTNRLSLVGVCKDQLGSGRRKGGSSSNIATVDCIWLVENPSTSQVFMPTGITFALGVMVANRIGSASNRTRALERFVMARKTVLTPGSTADCSLGVRANYAVQILWEHCTSIDSEISSFRPF
jgi:hypothetical protein